MATLSLNKLGKTYANGFNAIPAIDLTISDGEFIVLVGPSGCGKSTLLRMVAGLEKITDGELCIDGRRVNDMEPAERDIAMVFQNYALYPHMSVYDNMAYGLRNRGVARAEIEQKVQASASMLGLTELLSRKPRQLSGGQRQRVAMGRAMVREPKAFLFDEPLSNLDAKLRVQMRIEIRQLQRKLNTTTLYVTHDQVEAMTLADRLVVLNKGHAEQIGTPLALYERPATPFVAAFIGSPAMNLLDVTRQGNRLPLNAGHALTLADDSAITATSLIFGIRPEHLTPCPIEEADLRLRVEAVEALGVESLVHCQLGDGEPQAIIVRVAGAFSPEIGSILGVKAPSSHWHLFDATTQRRVN